MLFHTAKAKFQMCADILKPKKSITEKEHSQKNTLIFWKNSKLNMINDIYFNPSNKYMVHPNGMQLNPHVVFYRASFPTGNSPVDTTFDKTINSLNRIP